MNDTEINQAIARIEGLELAGINDAGQVFVKTRGKQGRLYNPAKCWDIGGPLLVKYRVALLPEPDHNIWQALSMPETYENLDEDTVDRLTEREDSDALRAGLMAIIASVDNGQEDREQLKKVVERVDELFSGAKE